MKKTTYILLGLVALIFVVELAIGIYFYATRIPYDEYISRHPEWFSEATIIDDDYYVQDPDPEEDIPYQEGSTVIDASAGGYSVHISTDERQKDQAGEYYTDTLIITSSEKNILVVR